MDKFTIIALILASVSAILHISGLAIPYWTSYSTNVVTQNYGLWQYCVSSPLTTVHQCASPFTVSSVLAGVRAMVVLGLLLMIAAVVCFLLQKFMMKDKVILTKVAAGLAILAGILMILGPVIYATDKTLNMPGSSLHAGFALCIVAGVFAIAGGVCMVLSKE